MERSAAITIHGNPMTLVGPVLAPGDKAPAFILLANDLTPVTLDSLSGKVLIVSTVPSLDTPTCNLETRRFNQEAATLGDSVRILTVSMDLPFAQARWCGAAGVDKVQTLSDHRDANFAMDWGVLIKELRLLARCLFVVGKDGRITYVQLVKEVSTEPDYAAVLDAARKAL